MQYNKYLFYLAQLGLRVHKDLTHFTLEVLAGHPDAAFAAQPLALAPSTSRHHLPPAPRQNTVTFQHQFVLCTWWRESKESAGLLWFELNDITSIYWMLRFPKLLTNQKSVTNAKYLRSLLPLLCASSWETELTVTLQTGQWR